MKKMKKRYITHVSPDIDSVCVCLFGDIERLERASYEQKEGEHCYDIGTDDSTKGEFDGKKRHSALKTFAEREGIDLRPDLLAEVEEQETTGKVEAPRFSLSAILAAVKKFYKGDDLAVYEWAKSLILGLQEQHEERADIEAEVARIEINDTYFLETGEKFGVSRGEHGPGLGVALNELGYSFVIYTQGYNLGISRYPGRETPDLSKLKPYLKGWFFHPANFLAAWGSWKNPETRPTPVGTPQTAEEVKKLMMEVFKSHKHELEELGKLLESGKEVSYYRCQCGAEFNDLSFESHH